MLMDGQPQNDFYIDNLNLDTNEMDWGRPKHDPRTLGGRVSAFPDSAFNTSTSPSAEAIPRTENLQPGILAPAPIFSPETLSPALITPPASTEEEKTENTPTPTLGSAINQAPTATHHESAEKFALDAEVELSQTGNIAGFYDKIRNYGDTK